MGELTVQQLVRWLEGLNMDLSPAIPPVRARQRLWEEIEKSKPTALEQVTDPLHLEHWPLSATLRWLEYFNALDESLAKKDKLISMLMEKGEDLSPPNFEASEEDNFLTEVSRHVGMVKQAASSIIANLSEQLAQADADERPKHRWFANGKALSDFRPEEFQATKELDIPLVQMKAGDRVDLTLNEAGGWAWVVLEDEVTSGWAGEQTSSRDFPILTAAVLMASAPLLSTPSTSRRRKPRSVFGYWPVWSECIPLNEETGKVDGVRVTANIIAGSIIGIRQTLTGIVSATLVFTGSSFPEVTHMFSFGICMMWYSTMVGSAFYAIFGRLQYNTSATQEVCAILYGAMAQSAAERLRRSGQPERIPATVLALIMAGTSLTGLCSVLLGKLGVGKVMLRFPSPVTSGFLGTIGFFLVRTALQISSGVQFQYFYPVSFIDFFSLRSMAPVSCLLCMVMLIRTGPGFITKMYGQNKAVMKLSGLGCQLFPLALFYVVILICGIPMEVLSETGWTFPAQAGSSFWGLWTTYSLGDADPNVLLSNVSSMFMLVIMSVLCTMTGVLGITGKFASGPDGDPSPMDVVDFDAELTTVGFGSLLTGLTHGVVTFHRLGSSIQLRMDGGTHRLAVLTSSAFVGIFFFTNVPLGHFIPKFFLGGLFMGSGVSFLESSFLSFRSLPPLSVLGYRLPSLQYWVTVACILVAAFSSPFEGIGAGLALSLVIFLYDSTQSSPVDSMSTGDRTMSRTRRPFWELEALGTEGHRILLLYLQGQLFFGSGQTLAASLVETIEGARRPLPPEFCILSFGKVSSIDASAAEQLKTAVKRVATLGCKVLFCRMNAQVFEALSVGCVVKSPDSDLRELLGLSSGCIWEAPLADPSCVVDSSAFQERPFRGPTGKGDLNCWAKMKPFRPLGQEDYDAFDDVTDALDYTGDQVLERYLYAKELDTFMQEYRAACSTGSRLGHAAFEAMNLLPSGFLNKLQAFCVVERSLTSGSHLPGSDALVLILQGAVAMVELPEAAARKDARTGQVLVKGFQGRRGTRLMRRYPPGSCVGIHEFLLTGCKRLTRSTTRLVVSSKFGYSTEVWCLSREAWKSMSEDLRQVLSDWCLRQLAEALASAVTEVASALQDFGQDSEEAEGMSLRCLKGEELEVILRHYSGWTLCRKPPAEAAGGPELTPKGPTEEGWMPDNCLSDHPRNMPTKQQHLILAGLQRLSAELSQVEASLYRIQTEGAEEEDSLQTLHAKVCELVEEYRNIAAILQANPHLLCQEESKAPVEEPKNANGLPAWVRVEGRCYYVSKSQKKLMSVTIKRVCDARQQILVTFDSDRNARKVVEFAAFEDMASCPLQPKEKSKRRKSRVKKPHDELAEDLRDVIQDLGPPGAISAAASSDSESDSYSSSDYTSSTASGSDRGVATGPEFHEGSGSSTSPCFGPEQAEAREAAEKAKEAEGPDVSGSGRASVRWLAIWEYPSAMADRHPLKVLQQLLEELMNFPPERHKVDKGNVAYATRITDAAALACAADCVPGSAQVIDDMMSGSTRTKLNARALIFVVDLILKRGMRQNPPPERNYAVMAKVMVPHLSKWLRVLLLTKRSPEQLEKTRKMISRWSDDGYLPMDGVLPLIELMDGGLPPVSEDSQQSQQSLDFSQSQPLPWSSPQRKEELRPGAGPSAPVPDTKQPQPAPAAPAAPAPEPPSKRVKRLSSSELPSREAEAQQAQELTPTRRLVLPSAQKDKKAAPGRRSLTTAEFIGCPTNHASAAQTAKPAPLATNGAKSEPSAEKPQLQPVAEAGKNEAPAAQDQAKDQELVRRKISISWRVRGDCRCLFRAVMRAFSLDPLNRKQRDHLGEPIDEAERVREREYADKLRKRVCEEFLLRQDEVTPLLENVTFEAYVQRMSEWQTWGDEICLKFLPDVVKRPLQVYSCNWEKQELFDAGLYIPSKKEYHGKECIVLLHNGKSHFDLVSTEWLLAHARERAAAAIQAAYRHYRETTEVVAKALVSHLHSPPPAPPSAERLQSAATLVRSIVRRYQAKEQLATLELEQAEMERQHQLQVAAAKTIQSVVRCFQLQQQLQDLVAMCRGSIAWQGACRRFSAQATLLSAWDEHQKRRSAAAVRLQAAQRSFRAQRELARRKAMRDGLLLLGPKEISCVRLFQRSGRRYLACLVVLEAERHRNACARRIQALWRGHRCREAVRETLDAWRKRRNLADFSLSLGGRAQRFMLSCHVAPTLSCLSDDERQLILSFVLGDLTCYPRVAAIDSRFFLACTSLGSWRESVIEIPRKWALKQECLDQLLKLSSSWQLAQKVVLPPFPQRHRLQDQLAKDCPSLVLAPSGEGPYMLFVMGCNLVIGARMSLHFFEPRYRWMCRRLFAGEPPYMFGFVTHGRAKEGSRGVLCQATDWINNSNGTYDVQIRAEATFILTEVWHQEQGVSMKQPTGAVVQELWTTVLPVAFPPQIAIWPVDLLPTSNIKPRAAASRIQSFARAIQDRKRFRAERLRRDAATQWIQTAWRRHEARKITKEFRRKRAELRACFLLQRQFRGHAVRRSTGPQLRRRQHAAARVQGIARVRKAKREVDRLRKELELRREAAVTKIQSCMRGVVARRKVLPQITFRRLAVIRMQAFLRGVLGRARARIAKRNRAAIKIESFWRGGLAKAEAMRRRAAEANRLLEALLEGNVPLTDGTPRTAAGGRAWLGKVTAALEWKAQNDADEEDKLMRLRRQLAFSRLPQVLLEEVGMPDSILSAALLDRSVAALGICKRRARHRIRALLQTQICQGGELVFNRQMRRSLSVDHGVLIRLTTEDAVREVSNLLLTSWSIAAARRSASSAGGASTTLQALQSGLHSLKRKLHVELYATGKSTQPQDSAALAALVASGEEAATKAVERAAAARDKVLKPLEQEHTALISESKAATTALKAAVEKVQPEVDAIKRRHQDEAKQAEEKLREERKQKHEQTVALHKIAISTQIEKERLEAGLVDKSRPKVACYKKVFANVKELQQELKDLEVSGTANRKSQGILQHTLRALESRAVKAESDAKAKVLFGEEEQDVKDFKPSAQVLKKQEKSVEQEEQFQVQLESEVHSLRADLEAKASREAGSLGAQLRREAEELGQAAASVERRIVSWQERADAVRQWLAEVVPVAKSASRIVTAADFVKACQAPESAHAYGACLRAVAKQVISLLSEAENVARGASSPREGDLAPHLQRLKSTLKALGELRVTFPDPPDVRSSPSAAKGRKRLYGREDGEEDDAESTEAPKAGSQGSRKNSISSPPPLPLSSVEGGEDAETDTPRELCQASHGEVTVCERMDFPRSCDPSSRAMASGELRLRFLQVGDLRVRVAEQGDPANPLVLLIHGWPECWFSWRWQLPALAEAGYYAVAPDMPGYGGTDFCKEVARYDSRSIGQDLLSLLGALGKDCYALVGHDWGALHVWFIGSLFPEAFPRLCAMSVPPQILHGQQPPVVELAARHGPNFNYIVYHNEYTRYGESWPVHDPSAVSGPADQEYDADPENFLLRIYLSGSLGTSEVKAIPLEADRNTDLKRSSGGCRTRLPQPVRGAPLPSWLPRPALDRFADEFRKSGFRGGLNYYRCLDRNWAQVQEPLEKRGRKVLQPLLFIAGELDTVIHTNGGMDASTAALRKTCADLRGIVYIPDCGHWNTQEKPHETNVALLGFLDSTKDLGRGPAPTSRL
ncbi:ephA [Symbiodinium microadriaticum]|nr:ephA [Symbiodinium microadriaticum]